MKKVLCLGAFLVGAWFLCNVPTSSGQVQPTTRRAQWVNPQPDIPYLPKPATRPADWLVEHDPVNPNATPEARALLKFLYAISEKHTMTGQHNFPNEQEYSTGVASRNAHKTPAIYGTDWGFAKEGDKDSSFARQNEVAEIIKQYRENGSVICLCWHEVRPTEDEPVTFRGSVQGKLTNEQFNDVITPSTDLYNHWCAQADVVAGFMKQLQDAHIPIIFRPYHEMNGDWFWWGGRRGQRGTMQMYRQIFDRFVNYHHLNNLLWVWNCDQPAREDRQFVDYFPGIQYMDILALDDYGEFKQSYYDDMNALSEGKVLAIAECGNPPLINVYQTQPKWTYWMRWATNRPQPRGGATRPGGRGAAGGGGGRRGTPVNIAELVKDPRMFCLQDQAYWDAINPVRGASALPPGSPPPPPSTQP